MLNPKAGAPVKVRAERVSAPGLARPGQVAQRAREGGLRGMRSYLVVMDESAEAAAALRWAARRAARNGFGIVILALIEPQEFVQWGGVQAAIEEEARLRAEAMVLQASGAIIEEAGVRPSILVREGEPVKAIGEFLKEDGSVAALVLGAAAEGGPGPLVSHFASVAGALPCPLIVIPNGLADETADAG